MALFGNTAMARDYCSKCSRLVLIIDGEYSCCDRQYRKEPVGHHRESQPERARRKPNRKARNSQLEAQANKCHYCELEFGNVVTQGIDSIVLKVEWDHNVPWAFNQDNRPANFVAACQICNHIKSDMMFFSHEAAKEFIASKRVAKGYV